MLTTITPFLWYDTQALEAAEFYVAIFENSRVLNIMNNGGAVLTVEFELDGHRFIGLNGGPMYKFTEAVSFSVDCETQEQVDYLTDRLTAGGGEEGHCGWVKDKYGLSWQVNPRILGQLLADPDPARAKRAMNAMLKMKRIDIAELKRAAASEE